MSEFSQSNSSPQTAPAAAPESADFAAARQQAESSEQTGQTEQTGQAEQTETAKNRKTKMFSAKRLATMAVFAALAYVVSFLEITVFPGTAAYFLKLDFGNMFILLVGFLLGPVEGIIACAVKELLRIPMSGTGGVGELANILTTTSFILLPTVLYKFHKGLKVVIPALAGGCLIATGAALLANRFILFPAFSIADVPGTFADTWAFILAFNLIKTVSISLLTMLLYKRLSAFMKKMKI